MRPCVGRSSPATRWSKVLLPQPLGPTSESTVPSGTLNVTGPSAWVAALRREPRKVMDTASMAIIVYRRTCPVCRRWPAPPRRFRTPRPALLPKTLDEGRVDVLRDIVRRALDRADADQVLRGGDERLGDPRGRDAVAFAQTVLA